MTTQDSDIIHYPFEFTGNGKEYFFICLRTTLLAILTLGIYDAWGSVERRRYLLGHTQLNQSGFSYHAKPKTILIGRVLAILIIILWQVMAIQFPSIIGYGSLALIAAIPWLMISHRWAAVSCTALSASLALV